MEESLVKQLFIKKITGCSPDTIRKLISDIMACINKWNQLKEDDEYEFRLVLNELISNAAFHGNEGLSNKSLTVAICEAASQTLSICVEDQGKGFDYSEFMKGKFACDTVPLLEYGRGLKLVQTICDNVQFNKAGNLIKVYKTLR